MNENEFFDNTDYNNLMNEENRHAEQADELSGSGKQGQTITQDGMYGWQSVVPSGEKTQGESVSYSNASENVNVEDRDVKNGYTHTGAYAEASAKELSRAAREARRSEKRQRRETRRGKGSRHLFGRIAAAVLCGVLFGGATAGAFIGVMHLTGYVDRFEHVLNAADRVEEYATKLENTIPNGTVVSNTTESDTDVQAVYNRALPSVVAITNTATYNYNFGFYSYQDEVQGSGSGIVIGKNETELLIVTNYHVIEGANSLTVTFVDGETVEAYTKGTAPDKDLAVVAVMLKDMKADTKAKITIATLGSEKEVAVGQKVVAIGNALGYGQVLTVGYISAVDREVNIDNKMMTLVQTDAAINPGNSGGALLNMNGEVIGINSAKYSDTNVEGMGFAIPISLVKEIIDDLMTRETLVKVSEAERGYLGVSVQTVSENRYGMPIGACVVEIAEGTPAAESDLLLGDIITEVNGTVIESSEDLTNMMTYYKGGETITLTVQRRVEGPYQEKEIQITLAFRKNFVKD